MQAFISVLLLFIGIFLPNNAEISEFHKNSLEGFSFCLENRDISRSLFVTRYNNAVEYEQQLKSQWNTRKERIYPLGYFLPAKTVQVQHAVVCGAKHQVSLIPNSGGHSYEALSSGSNTTVVIDFRNMKKVSLNKQASIASLQPGSLVGPINGELWEKGKVAIPMGNCLTVGIGGHAIGGGVGYFSTMYGLTIDNVLEYEMVDSEGRAVTATKFQNPELFWGLRGAGAGYLGIITNVKVRVISDADKLRLTFAKILYPTSKFAEASKAYQDWIDWAEKHEPNVFSSATVSHDNWTSAYPPFPKGNTGVVISLLHIYDPLRNPRSNASFVNQIPRMFPAGSAYLREYSYLPFVLGTGYDPKISDKQTFKKSQSSPFGPSISSLSEKDIIQALKSIKKGNEQPRYFYTKSMFIKRKMRLGEITEMSKLIETIPNNRVWILVNSENGAIKNLGRNESAYVHRDSYVDITIHVEAVPEDGDVKEAVEWVQKFFQILKPLDGGETYQNYPDLELEDYLGRFYGSNLNRLVALKKNWDPTNYFKSQMSLPISL